MRIKKGLISEMKIVLVIVVIVILFLFSGKLYAGIKKSNDRDTCKTSVLAQSVIMNAPGGENLVQPDCKTFNVNFYDNRVEINDERVSVYDSRQKSVVKSFDGITDEIVNQVVAEELRWCWYEFLEGKRRSLTIAPLLSVQFSSPKYCFLCAEITFDDSVNQAEFRGFYEYTKRELMLNSQMTYYQYYAEEPRICEEGFLGSFANTYEPRENCWEDYFADQITNKDPAITPENTVFRKGVKYVVLFMKHGRHWQGNVASPPETYFSYIFPYEILSEQCNSLGRGSVK